jgi:peptidoglycan/LPS O-acetylase OafA/YrhL
VTAAAPSSPGHALRGTYDPSIDGLRFLACLLVFFHHAPRLGDNVFLAWLRVDGWMGVDLFFTLSAYLLFRNLRSEHERTGRIDVPNFFARRLLRIYPLMALYLLGMIVIFGPVSDQWGMRTLGALVFVDNIFA